MISKKKLIGIVVVGVVVILTLLLSFTIVRAGHTGVLVTMGAVSNVTLSEGMHLKIPFVQSVVQIDNRTQKVEISGSAASKDLQTVNVEAAVNYRVKNDMSAFIYKNIGTQYESVVITPAIQESIKAVTAQFTAEQLITKRKDVSEQIKTLLSDKLLPYGIQIEIFNVVNFDFSAEFNAAVEAKQTAEQNALKAEQDLVRIEIEAKQKIEQAKAEAESIRLIQETLAVAPQYIEYIKWTKWNGVLPKVMTDSGDGMIFDISSIVSDNTSN